MNYYNRELENFAYSIAERCFMVPKKFKVRLEGEGEVVFESVEADTAAEAQTIAESRTGFRLRATWTEEV